MARFLVQIAVELPPSMPAETRASLIAREQDRGRELKAVGTIQDMWRLPGRLANVGIWRAADAEALHEAITSLPVWPWAQVEVVALASHYLTNDLQEGT